MSNIESEDIEGIRRGLEQMQRGEGIPFEEFVKEFEAKHNLTEDFTPDVPDAAAMALLCAKAAESVPVFEESEEE